MTVSTSDLISEGRRLHDAIVAWGAKHGVWAYRVLTPTGVFFEVWNPKTKTLSHDFPAKIQEAINSHRDALTAYAAWSRQCEDKWKTKIDASDPRRDRFCRPNRKENSTSAALSERD